MRLTYDQKLAEALKSARLVKQRGLWSMARHCYKKGIPAEMFINAIGHINEK
jgi:hypothetical protein